MAVGNLRDFLFASVFVAFLCLAVSGDSLKVPSEEDFVVKSELEALEKANRSLDRAITRNDQNPGPERSLRQQGLDRRTQLDKLRIKLTKDKGLEVKPILIRNLRDVHPQTLPPAPGTVVPFPFDPELLASFISLNMDKIVLFMPLFNNLKTYFDLSWFANSAVQTIANAAAKALLQDFPPVLGSAVVHGTIDAFIAEVQNVNLTGVNMSDAGEIVQSIVTRLSYSNILAKYYELVRNTTFPQTPSLKFKLESMLLNFSLVTLPNFLRDPLVEDIGNVFQQEFMKVDVSHVDTSTVASALRGIIPQVNWTGLMTAVVTKLTPRYPLAADALQLFGRELLSVSLTGVDITNPRAVFQAVVMQLHWLDITEWFYAKFRHYNPLAWDIDILLARELLTVNLTGVDLNQIGQVIQAVSARVDWTGMLTDIYAEFGRYDFLPDPPTLPSLLGTALLNITFGRIPQFLANPLTWQIGEIIMSELQVLDFSNFDPSNPMRSIKGLITQVNVAGMFAKIQSLPGMEGVGQAVPFVSNKCSTDTMFFLTSLLSAKPWALAMADAIGKPGAGILKGNLYEIGNYDQCLASTAYDETVMMYDSKKLTSRTERFTGEFCRVSINLPKSFVDGLGVDTKGIPVRLSWGICAPSTCTERDLRGVLTTGLISRFKLNISEVFCGGNRELKDDPSAAAAIGVLAFLIFMIVAGTLVDVIYKKPEEVENPEKGAQNGVIYQNVGYISDDGETKPSMEMTTLENESNSSRHGVVEVNGGLKGGPVTSKSHSGANNNTLVVRIWSAFSVVSNVPRVLAASHTPGSITCINGIRYISMAWIILCHTFYFGLFSISDNQTAENMLDANTILQRFTFMPVVYGTFAVDTFFLLSGFLVAYLFFKDLDKRKGKLDCMKMIVFYIHRFWRLTPIYMIVLMAFSCLYQYLSSGPMFPRMVQDAENCKVNWWTNLLYVNNLVNVEDMCMGWSWYLSNDMQFYILSPIFILALYFFPIGGVILTVLLLASSITSTAIIENRGAGNILSASQAPVPGKPSYYNDIYIKPWCRVGAYAIGLLLAKLIHYRGKKPFSKILALFGWIDALGVGLFLVYIGYTEMKAGAVSWSQDVRTTYESLSRPAFACAVAWVIFACHSGMGGIINSILSFKGFIPLARLTYAAYLIHPILMVVYMYTRRALIHLDDYNMAYFYIGHECLAFAAAFILSVAFESPFLNLEKIALDKLRKR